MTQRRARGDLDVDSAFDDPDNGWFGHVRSVDHSSSDHVVDRRTVEAISTEDTDRWPVPTVEPTVQTTARRSAAVASVTSRPRHAMPSSSGAWDFKVSTPRTRRPTKFVVAGVIVAALVAAGVALVLRGSGPAHDEPTAVAPGASTARPAPMSAAAAPSVPSQAPPPPPGPPPPPPPSVDEISPPVVTRDNTPRRQNVPEPSDGPEIGVTRTPTTRSPLSATPPPPPPPDRNSSTPGDHPRRRFGIF